MTIPTKEEFRKQVAEYNANPNRCKLCGEAILYKSNRSLKEVKLKKFCNKSCATTYNNMKYPKRKENLKGKFCIECGTKLKRKGKYCSKSCQSTYQYKEYIDNWKKGKESGIKGKYEVSPYLKRYLREKYGNKCCKCGWSEINPFTNKIPLEVEHKDGNYLNNSEDNLELLCPNCHSLTATYKGANRGNGRKERKVYT